MSVIPSNLCLVAHPDSRSRVSPGKSSDEHSVNPIASSPSSMAPMLHGDLTSKSSHVGLDAFSRMSVQDHSKENLVVTCCRNTATVKSIFNMSLIDLAGSVNLLSNLAQLGVFLDQHLDELPHLKHNDLKKIFSDVAFKSRWLNSSFKSIQVESFNIRKRHSPSYLH